MISVDLWPEMRSLLVCVYLVSYKVGSNLRSVTVQGKRERERERATTTGIVTCTFLMPQESYATARGSSIFQVVLC